MPPPEVVERFRCPVCVQPVAAVDRGLRCTAGHVTPERDGYLDAVAVDGATADDATARTAASFGYEWTTFDAIQPEDRAFWDDMVFAGVPPERYEGKVGLDAGCGKGRYTYFTAQRARAVAALDNSAAIEAATRNLGPLGNVAVVRADLRGAPFADASFDFVTCLGVLHHLPDPEAGFRQVARLVAPGGMLLVYLYSRPDSFGVRAAGLAAAATLRRVTVRFPHRVLRALAAPIAALLYALFVWPGRRWRRLAGLPLATYRAKPVRSLWLDTFDRLSAPLERRYVWSELAPWYERAGLRVDAVREQAGLYIVATKADTLGS